MGVLVGNTRDEAQKPDCVYVGAHDLAMPVRKIYMGNEWDEATLVWEADKDSEEAMYEIMKGNIKK